jgi:hypothetical protein
VGALDGRLRALTQIAGVGGTTLHHFANSPRAYLDTVQQQWPTTYAEFVPYYERVEAILPVIRDPRLPTKDAWALHGAARLGLPEIAGRDVHSASWRPQYNAILPPGYAGPGTGCNQCGHCYEGCMHPHDTPVEQKAKRSTNVSYVPHAEAHDGYRLVTNAFATQILTEERDGETTAVGVRWRDTASGEESEARSEVVILAAGCIESPRLWLNSGLPNSADAVGRYLTLHWFDFVTVVFDHPIHPYVGQNSQSRIEFPGLGCLETVGLNPGKYAFGGFTLSQAWGGDPVPAEEPWDTRGHVVGEPLRQWLRDYDRSLTLLVITDDEMHADNRVTLADDWPDDEHGPVPKVGLPPDARERPAPRLAGPLGRTDPGRGRGPPGAPRRLAAAVPAHAVLDAHGPRPGQLGGRREPGVVGGEAAVRHRRLLAARRARRAEPHPHGADVRHEDRRAHRHDVLRPRPVRAAGRRRHPSSRLPATGLGSARRRARGRRRSTEVCRRNGE